MYMFMYVCMEGFAYRPHDIIFRFAIEQHLRTLHIKRPIYIHTKKHGVNLHVCMYEQVCISNLIRILGRTG